MRTKDGGFACPCHHMPQPGMDTIPPGLADEEGNHLSGANDFCDPLASSWEAAWIDLGGEG